MGIRFEFDDSVSDSTREALKNKKKGLLIDPANILAGDLVRLFPEGSDEGYTFRCVARRHDLTPDGASHEDDDEGGNPILTFILGSL
ncbi:hypothetical protein MHM84_03745 [Halomonas sp. McH1-25]|uniref:hypothetical protein n=1 Tax=unclassified Halomonas TaxID=2609666 RepID=UPI001EF7125B|nr:MULTISPECIES: hypothetical protein [unclassified Halomonas]MCG7598886.1 hypothetical protein [Halomonas sp. McH1-25]MCP1340849.1 hypothetical protein [Halomonas sp. FL8]MCP1361268.1 hypothetical protein [Halomonas sp. BBD45]MCP1363752.1 hypothetical protein [Halomonas sp. BBD48]